MPEAPIATTLVALTGVGSSEVTTVNWLALYVVVAGGLVAAKESRAGVPPASEHPAGTVTVADSVLFGAELQVTGCAN